MIINEKKHSAGKYNLCFTFLAIVKLLSTFSCLISQLIAISHQVIHTSCRMLSNHCLLHTFLHFVHYFSLLFFIPILGYISTLKLDCKRTFYLQCCLRMSASYIRLRHNGDYSGTILSPFKENLLCFSCLTPPLTIAKCSCVFLKSEMFKESL